MSPEKLQARWEARVVNSYNNMTANQKMLFIMLVSGRKRSNTITPIQGISLFFQPYDLEKSGYTRSEYEKVKERIKKERMTIRAAKRAEKGEGL